MARKIPINNSAKYRVNTKDNTFSRQCMPSKPVQATAQKIHLRKLHSGMTSMRYPGVIKEVRCFLIVNVFF